MSYIKKHGGDDLLFPQGESGQTRYNQMRVIMFSGANAAQRMAEFIRSYTNRDGTKGLPMTHIGATSPYIDGGNMFYIYFQDNANDPFLQENFTNQYPQDADGNLISLADAEVLRAAAIAANKALIARLQGSDAGWRTN
jgi:hypothetical protein